MSLGHFSRSFGAGTWAYFATIATTYMFTLVPFVSLVFGWHPVTFSRPFALASTAYLVRGIYGFSPNCFGRGQGCRLNLVIFLSVW
jgi:hypothetical protein